MDDDTVNKQLTKKTPKVLLLALALTLLIVNPITAPQAEAKGKKASEGYVAARLTSNENYWQYLYFNPLGKTDLDSFFSFAPVSQKRFKYTGDNALIVKRLPVGRYYWKSYHTSGGGEAGFTRDKHIFTVHAGKITYIGDINLLTTRKSGVWKSSVRVSFPVRNNASAAKKELAKEFSKIYKKNRFQTKLTSLK